MGDSIISPLHFSARLPLWLRACGFGMAYLLCALASRMLSFQDGTFVSFWLPAGLYVAVLLLHPRREWPALIVGACAGNVLFDLLLGTPWWVIAAFCAANTLHAVAAAWPLSHFSDRPAALFDLRHFLAFLITGTLVGPALGSAIGAATLVAAGFSDSYLGSWQTWLGSTGLTVLLFSPLILSWLTPHQAHTPVFDRPARVVEATVVFGGIIGLTCYLIVGNQGIAGPFDARLMPLLLWAGLRFGMRGASAACVLFTLLMSYLVTQGHSSVPLEELASHERIFNWQIFLAINALVGMVPAVVVSERKQAEAAVHRLNANLERRVAERTAELSDANRELEAFSYSVSHDLRAPLRHIAGFAGMLKADAAPLNPEAMRQIERIEAATQCMTAIVDGLLNLSQSTRAPLRMTEVSLNALVEEVKENLTAEHPGQPVEWQIAALPRVSADADLLRAALTNLLDNAVKYSSRRNPARIEIGLAPQLARSGEIAVFIRDNGAGFDMRFVDKLFGICQRLHSNAEFKGTGIGLANVHRIIQRHSGRVWAEAEVDKGAVFYFTLPGRSE